jgi:hypothetical protein
MPGPGVEHAFRIAYAVAIPNLYNTELEISGKIAELKLGLS